MPTAFLITPFTPDRAGNEDPAVFDAVQEAVRGAALTMRVHLVHPAEISRAGVIMDHVDEELDRADLVIAILTGQNPNVFFELGRTRSPAILIIDAAEKLPFDVRHHRTLTYAGPGELETLRDRLGKSIAETLATQWLEKDRARARVRVPPLPPDYINRPAEVNALVSKLLSQDGTRLGAVTAIARGAGGMGKTTLAKAVAHQKEVMDTFYDGILWVTLGTQPKLVNIIADLCRALGDQLVQLSGLNAAESRLRDLLENRRCLLIVDDVWRVTDLHPFLGLGPSVATLVTTRVAEVARNAGEDSRISVEQMTTDQGAAMLLAAVPDRYKSAEASSRCRRLAEGLGRWPLLLRLGSGQLRAQFDFGEGPQGAFDWIENNLRDGGVTALDAEGSLEDFENPITRDRAFATSIGGSLALLGGAEQQAFLHLGVFPEDVDIPLPTAGQLWGLSDAKGRVLKLADLSLVDLQLGDRPVIRLHDEILRYAAGRLRSEGWWAETHKRLVVAWKDLAAPQDDYAWRWVCYHLKEAGDEARLADLLFDYDAVKRRLVAKSVGIDQLLTDYGLINHLKDGAHLQRVLIRAAYILGRWPDALAQQLLGRVSLDTPLCQRLLRAARTNPLPEYLVPRTPSLASAGSVVRKLVQHQGGLDALALTGDGRVVTGGSDGHVYCTRLDGGKPLLLAQHEGEVSQLMLTDTGGGCVVTGGGDGRVYCTRLDGGEPQLLAQHERGLQAVSQLVRTADGRVVTGGRDGRVYCTRLDGGEPQLLAKHEPGFSAISELALTGDGRVVTGGGEDGRVYCARLDGGEPLLLARHERGVSRLALTGDGRVVTGGWDGRVYCARLDGGEPLLLTQHEDGVWNLELTGDGRVVTGGGDDRVYCTRLDGGEPQLLVQHEGRTSRGIQQLALTGDGRVVTGGQDGRVYCTQLDGGQPLLLAQHEGRVLHLALTAIRDGRVVTGGGEYDGRVYCTRLDGGEPQLLAQHEGALSRLALTGDGRVVTGGEDGRVYCARLDGGKPLRLMQHEGRASQLALTSDGRVVTGGGEDGRVYCTRLDGDEPLRLDGDEPLRLVQHEGEVSQLALTGDGRVVSGGNDGRVYWARLDGGEPRLLAKHEGALSGVSQLALTSDGRVVTGGRDGRVYCARLDKGEPRLLAQHEGELFGGVSQLALTGDGRVVTGGNDGRVYCAQLDGGELLLLAQHEGALPTVSQLALTGDGRVVTGGTDGRVYCARLDKSEPVLLAQHKGTPFSDVLHLALTGDGRVVTGGWDGRVYCTRLDGGEPLLLAHHEAAVLGRVSQLALTGDGRVVTGGTDGRVYCTRLDGGEPLLLAQHEKEVCQLALTGDGRLVTGGEDGRVGCTRLDGGKPLLLVQHEGAVSRLELTGDGHVVTGGGDGRVYCTRLDGGKPLLLAQHEAEVSQLALTGDNAVLSSGRDGTLFVCDLAVAKRRRVFFCDLTPQPIAYDAAERVIVAGDASGNLHILPIHTN